MAQILINELRGLVRDSTSYTGLAGYVVTAYRVDPLHEESAIGRAVTRLNGEFVLCYGSEDFVSLVDPITGIGGPAVVLRIANRYGHVVRAVEPLADADRFTEICLDLQIQTQDQRPTGRLAKEPLEVFRKTLGIDDGVLHTAGIVDDPALLKANLPSLAYTIGIPIEKLKAARLLAVTPGLSDLGPDGALALVTLGEIDSREKLAAAHPQHLISAIQQAKKTGIVGPELTVTLVQAADWIDAARGVESPHVAEFANVAQVTAEMQRITDELVKANPGVTISEAAHALDPVARSEALQHAKSLMDAAGVYDLASLGAFVVSDSRVIGPGYYVAWPTQPTATQLGATDLRTAMVEYASRYGHFEILPDCLRFAFNPVTDACIFGSLAEFTENGKLIIGKGVTSLTIITDEIGCVDEKIITYEDIDVAPPPRAAMVPSCASPGQPDHDRNVYTPGASQGPGRPNPGRRGGDGFDGKAGEVAGIDGDVVGPAPSLTIYVKRIVDRLPSIELAGRKGGVGQPGQTGGRGGNGAAGRPSVGGLWCSRGVGCGGHGGTGGRGGDGAVGGAGGAGGRVSIYTLDSSLSHIHIDDKHRLEVQGGPGGDGGPPGMPGPGGQGGNFGQVKSPCDPEPKRVGNDGSPGPEPAYWWDPDNPPPDTERPATSIPGCDGPEGPYGEFEKVLFTQADWDAILAKPWITRLEPWEARPGQTVKAFASNITADTVVLMNGRPLPAINMNAALGTFEFRVPVGIQGGSFWIQLQVPATYGVVRSNVASFRVLPHLDSVCPRSGLPGSTLTLRGDGFAPGAQVRFSGYVFPAVFDNFDQLRVTLPDYDLIAIEPGRKVLDVVNPDGRVSDAIEFDLTYDIIVRVKAWLVFPDIVYGGSTFWGPGPERTADDVRRLFGGGTSPRRIWIDHHVVLEFDPDVGMAWVPADMANSWPRNCSESTSVIKARDENGNYLHFEPGAINFYFVDDIDDNWADGFACYGTPADREQAEWVVFEDTPLNSDEDDRRVAAHELGHVFGLHHVCGPDGYQSTFGRECCDEDARYLMDPGGFNWTPSGHYLTSVEIRIARQVARLWHKL